MSEPQFYLALIGAVARAVVLVIAAVSGTLCIYLGWRLYRDAIISRTTGEFNTSGGTKIKLWAAGPGVFFVVFGAWLLVHVVNKEFRVGNPVEAGALVSPAVILAQYKSPPTAQPAPSKPTTKCAIGFSMSFWDGSSPPTAIAVERSLELAIKSVRASISKESDVKNVRRHEEALEVLQHLRRGVVK